MSPDGEAAHLADSFYVRCVIRGAARVILIFITNVVETAELISEAHEQRFGRGLFDANGQRAASKQACGVSTDGQTIVRCEFHFIRETAAAAMDLPTQPARRDLMYVGGVDGLIEDLWNDDRVVQPAPELFASQPRAHDVFRIVDPDDVLVPQSGRHGGR